MADRVGEVSGEGGPFQLADRSLVEQWRGVQLPAGDYESATLYSDDAYRCWVYPVQR